MFPIYNDPCLAILICGKLTFTGVSKGGKKGESNPNLESAGPTKWPTFPGNKMPGGAATGVRPQMAAQSRAPIKRAAPSFQEGKIHIVIS